MVTAVDGKSLPALPKTMSDTQASSLAPEKKKNNWGKLFHRETPQEKSAKHIRKQYNGGRGITFPYRFRKPKREFDDRDVEAYNGRVDKIRADSNKWDDEDRSPDVDRHGKIHYLDPFGHDIYKYEDVDTYLSPTNYAPRRLLVQSTALVRNQNSQVSWRRVRVHGTVPIALKMAEWAINPQLGKIHSFFRVLTVALPLQLLLALPGAQAPWEWGDVEDNYIDYPGYYWKWPKHAINPLDMRGDGKQHPKPDKLSSKKRLLRPRQLIVLRDGQWSLDSNPSPNLQYIFISWTWSAFSTKNEYGQDDGTGEEKVRLMAEYMTLQAGLTAYWLDTKCNAPPSDGDLLTSDVNRMCDVIRGCRFVALLLPDVQSFRMEEWGNRMWTLPEGLLAPGNIRLCTWRDRDNYEVRTMGKVEMTSEYWRDESDESPARVLAEHYAGTITLSRLELFSTAIEALSYRVTGHDFTGADTAYALMGLLHYRIDPDPTDSLFQVVARLSLANDNDRLIERVVAMFPRPDTDIRNLFKVLAEKDQYGTHLWDVEPRCEVVGVGDEDNTVILNECRAVPIRWKRFPRMSYKRHQGTKKMIAQLFVRSGAWWIITGYSLAFTYAPFFLTSATQNQDQYNYLVGVIVIFLGVGLCLACFAPHSVRRLFGGQVLEAAPHLVGFEGVMPVEQLEKIIFGNAQNRLTYEPSSTPYGFYHRDRELRLGKEPPWVTQSQPALADPPLAPGHRLFTLVDTGNLSVSIFQAKHPPTVALICGAEGGMLRAVLCSWRFANDCLYKETVIRVPSSTWEQTKPAGWLKVSLNSQGDVVRRI